MYLAHRAPAEACIAVRRDDRSPQAGHVNSHGSFTHSRTNTIISDLIDRVLCSQTLCRLLEDVPNRQRKFTAPVRRKDVGIKTHHRDCPLARSIPHQIRPRPRLTDTTHIDKRARHLVLLEPRHDDLGAQIERLDIHLEHEVELIFGDFVRRRRDMDHARTVDDDIETVGELRERRGQNVLPRAFERDVGREGMAGAARARGRGGLVLFRVDVDA